MPGGTLLLLLLIPAGGGPGVDPGTGPTWFAAADEAESDPGDFVADVETD